jgi:hypothetical protein
MMTRVRAAAGLLWGLQAGCLAAQSAGHPWQLSVISAGIRFAGASVNLSPSAAGAGLRPSQRFGLGAGLVRRLGDAWEAGLELGAARGHLEIEGSTLALERKDFAVHRYRAALAVTRRVVRVGTGEVAVGGAATVDHWQVESASSRTRVGGEARLALRVPAGRWTLDNTVSYGWSASPWNTDELTAEYRRESLKTLTFAAGLRFRL